MSRRPWPSGLSARVSPWTSSSRPMQNGFIERFNGSYTRGVLDTHILRTLSEFRERTEHWLADYNQQIPYDSLGGLTPAEFRDQHQP
ncbi:transposase [Xanthomonas campestris pv. raphani]|nr:transposase [Xanthomonas campestris]MEA9861312.1 transposase [Xanthomonas campestris pv. raphani]MEA9941209.1 transposase [Xanthomonas campestris pv. raphani]